MGDVGSKFTTLGLNGLEGQWEDCLGDVNSVNRLILSWPIENQLLFAQSSNIEIDEFKNIDRLPVFNFERES